MFVRSFLVAFVATVPSLLVSASPFSHPQAGAIPVEKRQMRPVAACILLPDVTVTATATAVITEASTATVVQCSDSAITDSAVATQSISTSATLTSIILSTGTTSSRNVGLCYGGTAPKSTQTASNGDVYGVCPKTDFYGGDIPYTARSVDNLASCIEACTATKDCIAAAYTLGICYLKGTRNLANFNNDVDSVYKISNANTASPAVATSTTTGVCVGGATPTSMFTASNGDVYGICSGNDFWGGDMQGSIPVSDIKACNEACSKKPNCVAVAFEFGNCWLKNTRNFVSFNSNVTAAYKISKGDTTNSVATTGAGAGMCVGGTGPTSTILANNGDVYGICSGTDFYGGDMQNGIPMSDLKACNEACSKKPNCVAVAFTSGTCWLKNTRNLASFNNGVDVAYKISSPPQSTATSTLSARPVECKQITDGSLCPTDQIVQQNGKVDCGRK